MSELPQWGVPADRRAGDFMPPYSDGDAEALRDLDGQFTSLQPPPLPASGYLNHNSVTETDSELLEVKVRRTIKDPRQQTSARRSEQRPAALPEPQGVPTPAATTNSPQPAVVDSPGFFGKITEMLYDFKDGLLSDGPSSDQSPAPRRQAEGYRLRTAKRVATVAFYALCIDSVLAAGMDFGTHGNVANGVVVDVKNGHPNLDLPWHSVPRLLGHGSSTAKSKGSAS